MNHDITSVLLNAELPEALLVPARQALAGYVDRHQAGVEHSPEWLLARLGNVDFARELGLVWGGSPFVADICQARPGLWRELAESGDLYRQYPDPAGSHGGGPEAGSYAQRLSAALDGVTAEADLLRVLRAFRQREMVRILWRDFTRRAA